MSFTCAQCMGRFMCRDTRGFGSEQMRVYECPNCKTRISTREIIEEVRGYEGKVIVSKRRNEVEMFDGLQWGSAPKLPQFKAHHREALREGGEVTIAHKRYRYKRQT